MVCDRVPLAVRLHLLSLQEEHRAFVRSPVKYWIGGVIGSSEKQASPPTVEQRTTLKDGEFGKRKDELI